MAITVDCLRDYGLVSRKCGAESSLQLKRYSRGSIFFLWTNLFIILSAIRRELVIFYFTSIQLVWMYRLVKNFCLQQVSTCYRRIDLNDSQFVRLPLKLLRILLSVSEWRTCKYSITCRELILNCPASLHKLRWTATCKWNSQLFLSCLILYNTPYGAQVSLDILKLRPIHTNSFHQRKYAFQWKTWILLELYFQKCYDGTQLIDNTYFLTLSFAVSWIPIETNKM